MQPQNLAFLVIITTVFATCSADNKHWGFLAKYGYLKLVNEGGRSKAPTPEQEESAILNFQRFAGLTATGVLDEETVKKMQQSRCGVKDIFSADEGIGVPVNLVQNDRWPKRSLTWSVRKFSKTSKMSTERQLFAIRQGFRRWAEVTQLKFQQVTGKADIELSFERLEHGDKDSFDGRGATLAHAFSPVDSRTHFDDDEDWTEGVDRGTNLEHVATHEIGHALGLYHMPGIYPVMSPYYPGYVPDFKLHRYDIMEIQRLYGKRETNNSMDFQNFCGQEYRAIKAAMRLNEKADYIFVDRNMVISGMTGRRTHIRRLFPKGPLTVDAAVFSQLTNTVFLFQGQRVWAFVETSPEWFTLKDGFPKDLENSDIRNPEAVVKINDEDGIESIFLVKEGQMWVWLPYHEKLAPGIGYPAKEFFLRIPDKIDAAISSGNIVHFIVGKKFYPNKPTGRITTKRSIPVERLLKCAK